MIQRHLTTIDANADTPSDQCLASEGAESEDICKGAGHPCSPSMLDEYNDPQDLRSASKGDERQSELPEDTPVALRTRSKHQYQDAHTLYVNDTLDRSQFGKEVKELISQLIEQNEEQKNNLPEIQSFISKE